MQKRRILVVDDEEDFLKIVKLNLEESGKFEVMTSNSAKNIISLLHRFTPEVILLDLLMSEVGGIEASEMLNQDPMGKGVPIIVLSALDKEGDKLKAYSKGVVDYLVKPIGKDELIAKIEKVIEERYG